MPRRRRYKLIYDVEVHRHLSAIDRKYHSLIRREMEESLTYEPETETRNRKPLLRPSIFGTSWELRFGPSNSFRIFYRADREARVVYILAIGIKKRDRLFIGKEEFGL
jgi:mRNA-degrading endonuclease RelE of RelBE toxin-antitoxin system